MGTTKGMKKSVRTPPQLPEEIIWEILVLLPAKSLLRLRYVCKTWRAIISDPAFVRTYLLCLASRWEQGRRRLKHKQPPEGILCLSLWKNEEFSVTNKLPDSMDSGSNSFILEALQGQELCLATLAMGAALHHRCLGSASSSVGHPSGNNEIIVWKDSDRTLYCYELGTLKVTALCETDRMEYQGHRSQKWKKPVCFT
ncbi:hypothetical protein PR202_gb26506 [Eleusine coracana subsp. coracana]|uniref:F-box domain-containing protein n=1 Tax=Eleusine coracana subsp. coracana TaxID=191504 RepID=A0AAV5FS15_ELECO|nr:hypothetical protein PR202_gb26506 [Eleusine coracana subsp. coracana]